MLALNISFPVKRKTLPVRARMNGGVVSDNLKNHHRRL